MCREKADDLALTFRESVGKSARLRMTLVWMTSVSHLLALTARAVVLVVAAAVVLLVVAPLELVERGCSADPVSGMTCLVEDTRLLRSLAVLKVVDSSVSRRCTPPVPA